MQYLLKISTRTYLRRSHDQISTPSKIQYVTRRRYNNTDSRSAKSAEPKSSGNTSIPVPNTVTILPLWQRLGPATRALRAYAKCQRSSPYLTQFASSLVIYTVGDACAQSIGDEQYDLNRTARALIIGGLSSIPSYKWFIFLGQHFNYTSKALSLITKVAVNQMLFTPIFNTYFFAMQNILATAPSINVYQTWLHVQATVPQSVKSSCMFWPGITAFSFTFIEPQYRSIFAGCIAVGWQTYLSFLNKKAERSAESGTSEVSQK